MESSIRNLWIRRIAVALFFVGIGMILSFGVLVTWLRTYPDDVDPKNIYYVLWETRAQRQYESRSALGAMSLDTWPVRQVQGLTKDQLKARFGYIRTLEEVTPYYQACYSTPGNAGRAETGGKSEDAIFLRNSPWMVVMTNGTAVDLILCKGY